MAAARAFAEKLFGGPLRVTEAPGPREPFAAVALEACEEACERKPLGVVVDQALALRLRGALPGGLEGSDSSLPPAPTPEFASALLGAALAAAGGERLAKVRAMPPDQIAKAGWYAVAAGGHPLGHIAVGEVLPAPATRGVVTIAVSEFSLLISTLAALQPDDLLLLGPLPDPSRGDGWPAVVAITEPVEGAGRSWRRQANVRGDRVVLEGPAAPPPATAPGELLLAVIIGETTCDISDFHPGDALRLPSDVTGRAHLAAPGGAPLVAGDLVGVGEDLAFRVVTNLATGRGLK